LCQKKSMSVKEYKSLVEKDDFDTAGKSVEDIERYVRLTVLESSL
jgi:hypothetical protein